jgi:hypothetical protein
MSGFFYGPPLLVHILIASFALSLTGILLKELFSFSTPQALAFTFAGGVLYFILALAWGTRHILLRGRTDCRQSHPVAPSVRQPGSCAEKPGKIDS